jgi:hypothetical protein
MHPKSRYLTRICQEYAQMACQMACHLYCLQMEEFAALTQMCSQHFGWEHNNHFAKKGGGVYDTCLILTVGNRPRIHLP